MTAPRTVPGRDCFAHFRPAAQEHDPVNAYLLSLVSAWLYPSIVTRCEGCGEKDVPRLLIARLRHWGFGPEARLISRSAFGRFDTQTAVAMDDRIVLVAFRGSENPELPSSRFVNALRDWLITDADVAMESTNDLGAEVDVHRGFWRALMAVASDVEAAIAGPVDEGRRLWITGHSMGGALATLAAPWLRHRGFPVGGVCTFGAPMVGGIRLANFFRRSPLNGFHRYVREGDPVPSLPPEPLNYQHAHPPYLINADGGVQREDEAAASTDVLRHLPRGYCEALHRALTDDQRRTLPPPPPEN
ncbi:MAG: hypothetical protein GF393_03455 [Armatimonadia bacterium]|nr:hypothetical protein [Armatimonadia bacterium]